MGVPSSSGGIIIAAVLPPGNSFLQGNSAKISSRYEVCELVNPSSSGVGVHEHLLPDRVAVISFSRLVFVMFSTFDMLVFLHVCE